MMAKIVLNFADSKSADGLRRHEVDKVNMSGNVSLFRFQTADILGLRPERIGKRRLSCKRYTSLPHSKRQLF